MKSPLNWVGGKTKIADWIVTVLPPHHTYVEPFAGSLAVLFAKDPSAQEIVNDIDGDLVNFWRIVRDRGDELLAKLERTPYARAEYRLATEPTEDPLERARRFFVVNQQAFAARMYTSGWSRPVPGHKRVSKWWHNIDTIRGVIERLKHVVIEQDDALAIIPRYDHPDTCFYVDPPYLAVRDEQPYNHRLSDHTPLLDLLRACRGKVVLSGYRNPLYDAALSDWVLIERRATITATPRRNATATECLWLNYDPGLLWS